MTSIDKKNKKNNDWSIGLLVKDKSGKIYSLHKNKNQNLEDKNQNLEKKEIIKHDNDLNINTSPKNDSFDFTPSFDGYADAKADFSFHPEDKFQLDKIAKEIPKDNSKRYSIDKIVDKLIDKHGLKFNKDNKEHFSNVIFDFFRNRKSSVILREVLNTKILINKKPLKNDLIDNLVLVIKGIKKKIDNIGGLVVEPPKEVVAEPPKEVVAEPPKEEVVVEAIIKTIWTLQSIDLLFC